jgi:hypothetical protein
LINAGLARLLEQQTRHGYRPPPLELTEAGHFTHEAGVIVVEQAMASFSS